MDDCIYTIVALSRVGCALYIHRRRKRRGLRGLQPPHSPFFGGGHSPHFCRIINNFLNFTTFNSLGLKNTILESSSTRLVCFGQQTTYVVSWFGTFHFFICTSFPPPPPWKAILFSFWCRHHWRLHPRGKNVVGVFKKKITKTSFYCLWGRGGGGKKWNGQLVCAPELVLLIFKFHTLSLILESAHLLTLLPLFSITLTLILSK